MWFERVVMALMTCGGAVRSLKTGLEICRVSNAEQAHGARVMMIQQKDNEGRQVELSGTAKRSRDGRLRLFISVYSTGHTANLIFTSIGLSKEDQDQLVNWIHESEEERRAE